MIASLLSLPLAAAPTADEVKPGWVALLIVVAMGVALALLMRSMVKQFRKVDFEEEPDPAARASHDSRAAARDTDRPEANGSAQP